MNISFKVLIVVFLTFFASIISATIINVPGDQPTIQAGINVAVNGDTVLVQPGTYVENINYNGSNITVASLFLTTQDTTFISQTTIDGNQNGSVVTFESGEDSTALLCGFKITKGVSNYSLHLGGGITCKNNSNPSIQNLIITDNFCSHYGRVAGLYCYGSSPNLKNILITDNESWGNPSGIFCGWNSNPNLENVIISNSSIIAMKLYDSSPTIKNSTISNNYGTAVSCTYSNPILQNVIISNNYKGINCIAGSSPYLDNVVISNNCTSAPWLSSGGGITCAANSHPILKNVSITNNAAAYHGGGITCYDSSINLKNVIITSNSTIADTCLGGGIYSVNSTLNLKNVLLNGNNANGSLAYGGGIYCILSSLNLQNVTSTNNFASTYGGGIYCRSNSTTSLVNCIMWNNSWQEIYFDPISSPNIITISYSDIQGGEAGIVTNNNGTVYWLEGNINEDPLFVGSGEDPYSLLEDSPCIDAGIPDTTGLNLPPWDIIGNHRIWDGDGNGSAIIDMGAYEYGAPPYVGITNDWLPMTSYQLSNYPNPFNPTTTIRYQLPENGEVNLSVYNIKGQKIKTIVNEKMEQGLQQIIWDGKNDNNQYVASGVYFYKLKVNDKNIAIKKCLLLK